MNVVITVNVFVLVACIVAVSLARVEEMSGKPTHDSDVSGRGVDEHVAEQYVDHGGVSDHDFAPHLVLFLVSKRGI